MSEENKEKNIIDLLTINNVNYIKDLKQITNIYNVHELIAYNTISINPNIIKKQIIIFDTPVFNSCYVIDEYNKFIDKLKNPELFDNIEFCQKLNKLNDNFEINYCDNLDIYVEIFGKFFKEIDVNQIKPVILIILPEQNEINIEIEKFVPFNLDTFTYIYLSNFQK